MGKGFGLSGLGMVLACAWAAAAVDVPLVSHGDTWHFRPGTNTLQANWRTVDDSGLDATWTLGRGGFGYSTDNAGETADCLMVISNMQNRYTTFWIRRTFVVTNAPDPNQHLILTVDYDDGWIAWLDGHYLSGAGVGGATNVPATNALAASSHESSHGNANNSPQPPVTNDLGLANARLAPGTHVLSLVGLNNSSSSTDFILVPDLYLGTVAPPDTNGISGTIAADTTWHASNSPVRIIGAVTVNSGVTLRIEPGVTVRLGAGLSLVSNGRILAEGNATNRIVFTRDSAGAWGRIQCNTSPLESRFSYVTVDGAGSSGNITADFTSLYLDQVNFTNTTTQLVTVDDTSLVMKHCYLPNISGAELIHFLNMPANGYCLFMSNFFGTTSGYNDITDLTGGNRPGPIAQFIGNIFAGAVDDVLDLDGTDAHIEGNIFMNVKQDATRASSSNPISTGSGGGNTSELVTCRNLFFNCDHNLLIKEHGAQLFQNNTTVRIVRNPLDSNTNAVVNFCEVNRGVSGGDGAILEGSIFWDIADDRYTLNYTNGVMFLPMNQCLLTTTNWSGWSGQGNVVADPLFVHYDPAILTYDTIRSNLALRPNSPALGAGPNGLDMGALVPGGASISGEPPRHTTNTSASLRIAGPGIYAYKWSLNHGPWSPAVPLTNSLDITATFLNTNSHVQLTNLAPGNYTLAVIGMNSAGVWQGTNYGDGPWATNIPTVSRTWTVLSPDTDTDHDGLSDAQELIAGTDPLNPLSRLKVAMEMLPGNAPQVTFAAISNHTYTLQFRHSLLDGQWTNLLRLEAATTNQTIEMPVPVGESKGYYRLLTPALP